MILMNNKIYFCSGNIYSDMQLRINVAMVILMMLFTLPIYAQFKAVITNLNNKKEFDLKVGDVFYFGTAENKEKLKGTLEAIQSNEMLISGKTYKVNDIKWIDAKGRSPKKNTSQIARILLYFGGGFIGVGAIQNYDDNEKQSGELALYTGAALVAGAAAFWLIPRQPRYDFTTRYLLEIIPEKEATN
jgi:hypothetical protein